LGKRWISVEHCGRSNRLSFEVNGGSAPSTPSKPKPSVPKKPDLFGHSGWTKPESPAPGEAFKFYYKGANMGTASAPASKTKIILSGDGGPKSVIINASGLKAKEPFLGWWSFPSGLPKGSHYFDVYLDYNNKVDELNEYNNHVYVGKIIW
jgi:subtilase family serine protease